MEMRLRRGNNALVADELGKSAATNGSKADPNVIAAEQHVSTVTAAAPSLDPSKLATDYAGFARRIIRPTKL
jgi:hypothetical protein